MNVKHRLFLPIVMSMQIVLTQEGVINVNVRLVMKPIAMTVPKARFHHPSGRTLLSIRLKRGTWVTGKGLVCNDINECEARRDNCPQYSVCDNNDGSFVCNCPAGFQAGVDGSSNPTCEDINEEMI